MQIDEKVRKLQGELDALQKTVSEMRSDRGSRSCLCPNDHQRVEEILNALHEDIQVFEKGAEVIAVILAGKEN